ncbi:MAG: hypothetical protein ACI8RC_002599, partial [Ilumatobacter sp.]
HRWFRRVKTRHCYRPLRVAHDDDCSCDDHDHDHDDDRRGGPNIDHDAANVGP